MTTFVPMRQLLLSAFLFLSLAALGQQQPEPRVIQISGVVVVGDSLYPAPFVSIYRTRDYRGTYSDKTGYFTMPALEGDTVMFAFTGLKKSAFRVPAGSDPHISLVQLMEEDTIMLRTTYILPYPSRENLRKELLALDLPNDNYFAFNRNNMGVKNRDGMYDFKDEALKQSQDELNARYNGGFRSGGNLLDKNAWNNFLKKSRNRN